MRSKVTPGKYISYFILISLLVIILVLSMEGYLALKVDIKIVMGTVAAAGIVLYIMYLFPIIDTITAVLLALSSIVLYIFKRRIFELYAVKIGRFIYDACVWMVNYMYYTDVQVDKKYAAFIVLAFAVLLVIILFILVIHRHNIIFTILMGVALISSMWYYGYDGAFVKLQQYMVISMLLYGYMNYDLNENRWRLRHDTYSNKIMISWIAYTAVAIIGAYNIANLMTADVKPVSIDWLNENIFSKFENAGYRFTQEVSGNPLRFRFGISTLGYQEKPSKLGGPVKLSTRLLFKAKITGDAKGPYYLRGTVKDYYSGILWDKKIGESGPVKNGEEILNIHGNTGMVRNTEKMTLEILPEYLNTTSIFNLWQPHMAEVYSGSFYNDSSGELYYPKLPRRSSRYTVVSYVPTDIYSDGLKAAPIASGLLSSKPELLPYLQLPTELISQRTVDLTRELTANCADDYEKAVAIQEYLRKSYEYTLEPSSVPNKVEFVDYFLFQDKKGYCTYFASAMAVMCRIAGIPSRYVEGFVLYDSDADFSNYYNVLASRAHAWVELYFDGYGWVRFEPTPGYDTTLYTKPDESGTGEDTNTPDDNNGPVDNTVTPTPTRSEDITPVGPSGGSTTSKKTLPWYSYLLAAAALALILRVAYKMLLPAWQLKKADGMEGSDAAEEYLKLLESKLKTGGIKRGISETPEEFGKNNSAVMSHYDIDLSKLMKVFGSIRFGNKPVDKDAREAFKDAIKKADMIIKDRIGSIKYGLNKYIF